MNFEKTVTLKDGRNCLLRNGVTSDGKAVLDVFNRTHEETDYLLTYSDENRFTASQEADFLQRKTDSANNVEIIAVVDDVVVGTAGIDALGMRDKIKHRAVFGIAITKEFWGLGIGKYLMDCGVAPVLKQLCKTIDYETVGRLFLDAHSGAACSRGFVVRNEHLPQAVLDDLHTSKQTYEMTL